MPYVLTANYLCDDVSHALGCKASSCNFRRPFSVGREFLRHLTESLMHLSQPFIAELALPESIWSDEIWVPADRVRT